MAIAGARAWIGSWGRIGGVLVTRSCNCRRLQSSSSSVWKMSWRRELHEAAGGADEQHHGEHNSSNGFRRNGHEVYRLQDSDLDDAS